VCNGIAIAMEPFFFSPFPFPPTLTSLWTILRTLINFPPERMSLFKENIMVSRDQTLHFISFFFFFFSTAKCGTPSDHFPNCHLPSVIIDLMMKGGREGLTLCPILFLFFFPLGDFRFFYSGWRWGKEKRINDQAVPSFLPPLSFLPVAAPDYDKPFLRAEDEGEIEGWGFLHSPPLFLPSNSADDREFDLSVSSTMQIRLLRSSLSPSRANAEVPSRSKRKIEVKVDDLLRTSPLFPPRRCGPWLYLHADRRGRISTQGASSYLFFFFLFFAFNPRPPRHFFQNRRLGGRRDRVVSFFLSFGDRRPRVERRLGDPPRRVPLSPASLSAT